MDLELPDDVLEFLSGDVENSDLKNEDLAESEERLEMNKILQKRSTLC